MQKLGLTNDTQKPLEVYVELNPDQPKDEMVIEGEENPRQPYFHINVYEDCVQIYPPLPVRVSINGNIAEPVWDAPKT